MQQPAARSPFIVGRPVRADEPIFGRAAAFQFIVGELTKFSSVNIVGERRMGKTSLLNHLKQYVPESAEPLVLARLDLQDEISNASRFYGSALRELLNNVPNQQRLEGHELARFRERLNRKPEAEYDEFRYILRQLRHGEGLRVRPVLVLDEFERLLEPATPDAFPFPSFFNGLRAHITDELLAMVVASRRSLATYFSDPSRPNSLTSTFPNYLTPFTLQALERDAADGLLLQQNFLTLSEAAEAWHWAGGHPCHLQVAGQAYYQGKIAGHDLPWIRARRQELKDQSCMALNQPIVVQTPPSAEQAQTAASLSLLHGLGMVLWTFPLKIGRVAQALGAKIDDLAAWLIGVGLIILVVLVVLGAATGGDVLDMLKKGLGL
jgi:hypothetical protein